MVLARRPATVPALVVPDEQSWTLWGTDPVAAGLEPVLDVGRVRRVLLPTSVPEALVAAIAGCLRELPLGVEHDLRPLPEPADRPLRSVVDRARLDVASVHADAGSDEPSGMHMHMHEDEDMMAITGEPSADGLVMEPLELSLGPLAGPLPGGIVADVVLDGDVVSGCTLRATLHRAVGAPGAAPAIPDLLAPVAWAASIEVATDHEAQLRRSPQHRWRRVAAVELERAVSHVAWVRALGRLLGWRTLVDAASDAVGPLLAARAALAAGPVTTGVADDACAAGLVAARARVGRLRDRCDGSRRLAGRTAGRGVLSAATVHGAGLAGPVARASGIPDDARDHDPLYRELGFAPAVRAEGDVRARTLLRMDDALGATVLAQEALHRARSGAATPEMIASPGGCTVEGPRGPVCARAAPEKWRLTAPGQRAALAAAGRAAVGLEWAAALAVLVSFDLSSWEVRP